jgi:predicted RNase H-like nuclease (RuvC/YqgF family)
MISPMRIAVTIPDPLLARVDSTAAQRGVSRAEVIRRACDAYLTQGDITHDHPPISQATSPDDITADIEEDRYLANRAAEMVHLRDEVKRLTREVEELTSHRQEAATLAARLDERERVISALEDRVKSQEEMVREMQHQAAGHIGTVQRLTALLETGRADPCESDEKN